MQLYLDYKIVWIIQLRIFGLGVAFNKFFHIVTNCRRVV